MKKNENPLSAYGVTDEQFKFYEKLYEHERKAFWIGVLTIAGIVIGIGILIAIIV